MAPISLQEKFPEKIWPYNFFCIVHLFDSPPKKKEMFRIPVTLALVCLWNLFFEKTWKTISYISVTKSRSHVTLFRHYSHIGIPLVLGPEIPFPCSAVQKPHAPLTSKTSNQCIPCLKPASETLGLLQMTFILRKASFQLLIMHFWWSVYSKYIHIYIYQSLPSQSILWRNIESGWCNKIVDPSIPRHDPFASALEVAKSTPCNDWKASAKCFATGSCGPNNTPRPMEVRLPTDMAPEKIGKSQKGNEYVNPKRPSIFSNRAVKKIQGGYQLEEVGQPISSSAWSFHLINWSLGGSTW